MAAVPESSLEAGLTALEQGNFNRAIAILKVVCKNSSQPTATKVQAQKGLVTAYLSKGENNQAISLLQTLSQSSDPDVRTWAISNYPQLVNTLPIDATGFIAFVEDIEQVTKQEAIVVKVEAVPALLPPLADKEENLLVVSPFEWRHAPRAQRWQPLKAVNFVPLWLLMAGSAIALFWLLREVTIFVMSFINDLLVKLPYLEPFQPFYHDPSNLLRILLLLLIVFCPWLLDRLLQLSYQIQPLSITQLAEYSPESERLLQRHCRQQGWLLPQLVILSTAAPVAFSYGNLRRTARIVVSRGLLTQLAADEIASIYALQLGHIASWDFALMSLFIVLTQGVYAVYRYVATWGDRQKNANIKIAAVIISSTAYGLWWLLSIPALWLSQLRIYYSDRFTASLTGNPNGLTRALIKIAIGITTDVQQQECTSWLLESLNLFMPISFYQAITLGSLYPKIEPILAWDCFNPYRYLLTINNTHPLIGDRLQRLNAFAQYWHLDPELNLAPNSKLELTLSSLRLQLKPLFNYRTLLQFTAVFGLLFGLLIGAISWLIGAVTHIIWIPQLAWMYGDWLLIKAFIPIALSISLFLRINFLFPDITRTTLRSTPSLADQLTSSTALPIDSNPNRLKGKLLGRRGIANWLGQDLLLNSSQGLFKLHYESPLGSIGNIFLRQSLNPMDLLGRHILVTGWFRRGATIWIDLSTLQTQTGKLSNSFQPLWATIMASAIALYGTSIIVLGR
ncbi:M48 family metalloprotease [Synechocystis sp. PCC 7509]|uniref:M48 family metalloprotease n=1 Tax=Synechocystis sp. PCC 7509 TaxID=927677 RepID=UPI0002AC8531|nr:M48 family metalloprotease [Synechocystis sp. PCC 7509]